MIFDDDEEGLFKRQFVATFLATWCANNYNEALAYNEHDRLHRPPVEDAEFLARKAWEHYKSI